MNPIVISTWKHGIPANEKALEVLSNGGSSLDAVELGVKVAEDDPNVLSVGYGALPDDEGRLTLDAAIMDWKARIGAVIFVEHIKNPVSVARLILENTEHTILAGEGAYKFALRNGFKPDILHTENSIRKYNEWKALGWGKSQEYHTDDFSLPTKEEVHQQKLGINDDGNHDTLGMVAMDKDGHISAACTTSGTAEDHFIIVENGVAKLQAKHLRKIALGRMDLGRPRQKRFNRVLGCFRRRKRICFYYFGQSRS